MHNIAIETNHFSLSQQPLTGEDIGKLGNTFIKNLKFDKKFIYIYIYMTFPCNDITAETIVFAASRPDHVNIADVVIYPVNQVKVSYWSIFLFIYFDC